MVLINMDMPTECHECPLQLKFKDGKADEWNMRRCVITQRIIEYPRPDWCPIKQPYDGQIKETINKMQWVQEYVDSMGEEHKKIYVDAIELEMKRLGMIVNDMKQEDSDTR